MADISAEIAALQAASRGNEVRQTIIDALNKENANTLPAVTASDAGKFLTVNNNGEWEVKSGDLVPRPTGTKTITQNGTHDVTNFADASVNVPNSYASGDEGKVVQNGMLASQTSRSVTENGTYDTTTNNEVVVNVSGGGGGVIQPLSVSANGTYNPPSGVDGYAPVVVNVSSGGSAVAFVHVDFDAGEVITATNGSTMLTSDNSGNYWFVLPSIGTWTFTNTEGLSRVISVAYGDSVSFALFNTLLPNSAAEHIISYNLAEDYDPVNETWNNIVFVKASTPIISYDSSEDAVNFQKQICASVDLGSQNHSCVGYAVVKQAVSLSGQHGIIGVQYYYNRGNFPIIYSNVNKAVTSVYGGDSDSGLYTTEWHVYAIAIDVHVTTSGTFVKQASFYIDGVKYNSPLNFSNSGEYVYLGYFDNYGNTNNILVKFFAVVDEYEDSETIIGNQQVLMQKYGITAQ